MAVVIVSWVKDAGQAAANLEKRTTVVYGWATVMCGGP
jgi:hypothetical protein